MIEGRELWCDVCDRNFGSVHPDERPLLYTPLDFCPACAVSAVMLVQIWSALPDSTLAHVAGPLIELANAGPYPDSARELLSGGLRDLAVVANDHLKDPVRLAWPGAGWVLQLLDSAGWSLTLRLAELAAFLARMEPDKRHSLDDGLVQCLRVMEQGDPRAVADACLGVTHALMEAVLQVVAFAFMSEPGTWLEQEYWTGEDDLAAEFGITKATMRRILEAMRGYGMLRGR